MNVYKLIELGVQKRTEELERAVNMTYSIQWQQAERIRQLEGALEDIAAYATIETPAAVTEIINGVLNKEEK